MPAILWVILNWAENRPENAYLKIAVLWADVASAVDVASINDLKLQLLFILGTNGTTSHEVCQHKT